MNNITRFIVGIFLIIIGLIMVFAGMANLTGCTSEPEKNEPYVLTDLEQNLVELAYSHRYVWETQNSLPSSYSKNATSICLREKNGNYILQVTYEYKNHNPSEPFSVLGMNKMYTLNLSEDRVYATRDKEMGPGADTGLLYGTVIDYDVSDDKSKKKENIAKAISGKAGLMTFRDGKMVLSE